MSILCWLATTEKQQRNNNTLFLSSNGPVSAFQKKKDTGWGSRPPRSPTVQADRTCNNVPATQAHGARSPILNSQAGVTASIHLSCIQRWGGGGGIRPRAGGEVRLKLIRFDT